MYAPVVVQVIANLYTFHVCVVCGRDVSVEEVAIFPKFWYYIAAVRAAFPVVAVSGSSVSSEPCALLPHR